MEKRSWQQREVREKRARGGGGGKGDERGNHHVSSSQSGVGGYNGSASSGALESPDTPSSANAARTRLSSARRSSIRRDIAIRTSGGTLFTLRARFRPVCARKQRLRGCLRVILPNRSVDRARLLPLSRVRDSIFCHVFIATKSNDTSVIRMLSNFQ